MPLVCSCRYPKAQKVSQAGGDGSRAGPQRFFNRKYRNYSLIPKTNDPNTASHLQPHIPCHRPGPSATGTVPEVHRLRSLAVARAALAHYVPSLVIGLGPVPPATHIRSAPLQRQHTGNPHWPGLRPSQRGERNFDTHKRLQPAKPSADSYSGRQWSSKCIPHAGLPPAQPGTDLQERHRAAQPTFQYNTTNV